ncbi:MAG: tRNA (adenosine(37)-N6)-threonylcarbamoyltransferase complex dimerization subunit type 1 TsaB [Pseudomonadota bacterium]
MSTTFVIDTSGPYCSLGVARGDAVFCQQERLERTHNQHLLRMIDGLLKQADVAPRNLDLIGFTQGPGSFTGVRIAAAACQAMALAADCEVVAVTTSAALAATAFAAAESPGSGGVQCLTSVLSRGQAYYLALYDGQGPQQADELLTDAPEWLPNAGPETVFAGALPPWLAGRVGEKQAMVERVEPEALLRLVLSASESAVDAAQALPKYFLGDTPWKKRNA